MESGNGQGFGSESRFQISLDPDRDPRHKSKQKALLKVFIRKKSLKIYMSEDYQEMKRHNFLIYHPHEIYF